MLINGVKMKKNQVKVVKLDEDHRLYFFQRKIIYKERRNGRLVVRFSGVSFSDLLSSPLIDNDIKKRLREIEVKLS